jgi:hypothetical protein
MIAYLWAEIWTQDLPNMKQECQPFNHDVLCPKVLKIIECMKVWHTGHCGIKSKKQSHNTPMKAQGGEDV